MSITDARMVASPRRTDSPGMALGDRSRAAVILALTVAAAGCATATGTVRPSPFPGGGARGSSVAMVAPGAVVENALALRGTPYLTGGDRPETGFDCSGLVRHVFRAAHIQMPRTVAEQFSVGEKIEWRNIQPGDLIFFDTAEPGPSHVGIAIDKQSFVHAPGSGGVVRVDQLSSPYWKDRLRGIRRVSAARE